MAKTQKGGYFVLRIFSFFVVFVLCGNVVVVYSDDAAVMKSFKESIKDPGSLGWTAADPCKWDNVRCDGSNRVTKIRIKDKNLQGTLPKELQNLTALTDFEVQGNQFSGDFPSLAGLSSLTLIIAHSNQFSSFPSDFFTGMTSLQSITIDDNPFDKWAIPESIKEATSLQAFEATNCSVTGNIPDLSSLVSLTTLHWAFNYLEGELPASFSGLGIQELWLNGQQGDTKLNGSIAVLANMTSLNSVWLYGNQFTGPIPDFLKVTGLSDASFRDNSSTGVVPDSFVNLPSLKTVNLTNNLLQGPAPKFPSSVSLDMRGINSFCSDVPGEACDSRVNALLSVVKAFGYPKVFASNWKGNDPCDNWQGVVCAANGNITVVNFPKMGLSGTISPNFTLLPSIQKLILSGNSLTGTIPSELTKLPNLVELDVSNNRLYGAVPAFRNGVKLNTDGNPDIGKARSSSPSPAPPGSPSSGGDGVVSESGKTKSNVGVIVGASVGGVVVLLLAAAAIYCWLSKKKKRSSKVQSPHAVVIHPQYSGDQDAVKITVAPSGANGGAYGGFSPGSNGHNDVHVVEAGNMVISIQVLKSVTNNFSEENILGRGGFGTVYKGELHDGTKIAVKRMESGPVGEKGQTEFMSEIAVLTKVRHRHLVALLGYCLDGNERLLVYEYMPHGSLNQHLFHWRDLGLKPLEWTRRLTIALDVARGVEYLHSLAHQSFIHRDLKPSNILLGDDMRARVSDFGLVRLAPEGKFSVETKLAGTFGYLAPEYAGTFLNFL